MRILRILLTAVVCVLGLSLGSSAFAQVVEGGIKVGATSSTLSLTGAPELGPGAKGGILGGGWIGAGGSAARVHAELLIATKNLAIDSPIGPIDVASRTVEVPVLFVARLRPDARVRPLIVAGPFLSFISKVTQTVAGTTSDIKDELKGTDAGFVIGGGLEIGATKGAIVLDVRYAFGLKDISVATDTTFKSRTIMASIGYRF